MKEKPLRPAGALKTIAETAAFIGLSRWTVTEMLETGALPGLLLRTGKRKKIWRIREEQLQKWLETREQETKKILRNRETALSVVNGRTAPFIEQSKITEREN